MNLSERQASEDSFELNLLETLITYIRHWKWFLVSLVLCLVTAFFYLKLITPEYKIETDLLIKDNKGSGAQNDLLKELDLFSSDKVIDNEIQVLKSKTIIEKVVKSLYLETSYFVPGGLRKYELYSKFLPYQVALLRPSANAYTKTLEVVQLNERQFELDGVKVQLNVPVQTSAGLVMIGKNVLNDYTGPLYYKRQLVVRFNNLENLATGFREKMHIEPVSKQATVLNITIEDALPERGKDFLNRLVDEYNKAAVEDKNKVTSTKLLFIEDRIKVIANELDSVENNVQQYKSSNKITDISAESQLFMKSVQDNDESLNRVDIQLNVLNNLESYLKNSKDRSSRLPSMLGVDDAALLGLVSRLADAQLKEQSLLETTPESNPLVKSYSDQIASLKQAIESSIENLKAGLEITKGRLLAKTRQSEKTIQKVPSKERGLLDVMRQQEIKNTLFTYLLQKREETAMSLASGVADSRTIDRAMSTPAPIRPVRRVVYMFFFWAGIIIPICIIYVRGLLNYKISRRIDIEAVTDTPILTEVSHTDSTDPLIVSSQPRSMVAEQLRSLRTSLQFILPNDDQKIILFTSSISGEGKSFVSLNLGASIAMAGKKVVILEFDLRKPKLHVGLDIDNEKGLSNYLIGQVEYKDIIKEIGIQKDYYMIPSGPIPPNPAEIIANGKLAVLLAELKKEFDYIILDAPPVGLVTDAQILGAFADLTIYVVRHNYTAKNHITTIDGYYKKNVFNNLNIVLNSIDMQLGYNYSYGYGYGYGYGYSSYGGGYYVEKTEAKRKFNLWSWLKK